MKTAKTQDLRMFFDLQLFAEGSAGAGDGGTGTAGKTGATETAAVSHTKGVKTNPLTDVKYGIQEDAQVADVQQEGTTAIPDRNAEFEKLIKGEYKDLYDAKVQDTIQKRLKGTKETVDKFNSLAPMLETLSKKYGVDASDVDALSKAIEEDDTLYEEEALEKGLTVEQLKQIRKMEKENAELKKQMRKKETQERANEQYAAWMREAEQVKKVYPAFDLQADLKDPEFVNLIRNNVNIKRAYEVIHGDEIIPAAMQFTAKTVEQKITNKIMANGSRPAENGTSSQSAAVVKSDVSQLSDADIDEINRRIARGEKISFGNTRRGSH